jgi:DNA-binding MarR family transcriptional regulator
MDNNRQELAEHIFQITFETIGLLNKIASEYDFSLTQMRLIGILRDRKPKMNEIASYLGLDKSSVSGIISRSEKRGLIERIPDEFDGRSVRISLTKLGVDLSKKIEPKMAAELNSSLDALDENEQILMTELLDKFLNVRHKENELN